MISSELCSNVSMYSSTVHICIVKFIIDLILLSNKKSFETNVIQIYLLYFRPHRSTQIFLKFNNVNKKLKLHSSYIIVKLVSVQF